MANRPNLVGQRFGRLLVKKYTGLRETRRLWICVCDCGKKHKATTSDLRYGSVRSCGCLLVGSTAKNSKHNHSSRRNGATPTYKSWSAMMGRCLNPANTSFKNYGGRGIRVHNAWKIFDGFLADMGKRPTGKTLDRINVDGNYKPSNCRWATTLEQRHNRRR